MNKIFKWKGWDTIMWAFIFTALGLNALAQIILAIGSIIYKK